MQRVAHAPNLAIATMWLDVLASDGIEATVQRQYLGGGIGELPPHHCLPEIWVSDDAQATREGAGEHAAGAAAFQYKPA